MIIDDPIARGAIARAVHWAVVEHDQHRTGFWLCEWYSIAGAETLYLLTGWRFEPAAGFAWRASGSDERVRHASGLPLDAPPPSWAHLVRHKPEPAAHAWIENQALGQVVDFSPQPLVWDPRDRLSGRHIFRREEKDSQRLQEKYLDLPHLVAAITRRATELAAPAVLARANGETGHVLERIAGRWPEVADHLVEELKNL